MSLSPTVLAALCVVVFGVAVRGNPATKSEAAGYGAPIQDQPYYPPPVQPNYVQVPVFVPPPPPHLHHSHICARDVGFTTYGGKRHRTRRPTDRTCDDVVMTHATSDQKKDAMKNCDRCCKQTARLNGFSSEEILGFITIIDKHSRCTCCAPALPTVPYGVPAFPFGQPVVGSFGGGFPSSFPASPVQPAPVPFSGSVAAPPAPPPPADNSAIQPVASAAPSEY